MHKRVVQYELQLLSDPAIDLWVEKMNHKGPDMWLIPERQNVNSRDMCCLTICFLNEASVAVRFWDTRWLPGHLRCISEDHDLRGFDVRAVHFVNFVIRSSTFLLSCSELIFTS